MSVTPQVPSKSELSSSIRELTDTIEARQEKSSKKRVERQQKRKAKEKGQAFERLVAPIILILSILFSLLALALSN